MYTDNRKNVADKYKKQSIMTASGEELTLMLYNRCLSDINKGIEYINLKDISKANNVLKNAQSIIAHLIGTLNMDIEISKSMASLYQYIQELLIQGNVKKDTESLTEAKKLVEEFRNTWYEAMKKASKEGVRVV
jgi:flagellar protein FliS